MLVIHPTPTREPTDHPSAAAAGETTIEAPAEAPAAVPVAVLHRPRRHSGRRVLVTEDPAAAHGCACTPELAAWLIRQGLAVAYLDETCGVGIDPRQWLRLTGPAPVLPSPAGAQAGSVGGSGAGSSR